MARTIKAKWHNIDLYITAERRIDKYNQESVVFLASTYKASPKKHVLNYRERWPIEKFFRTAKQSLGIEECFSRSLEIQEKHIAATMLAYSIAQFERYNKKLDTPEHAIRTIKIKKIDFYIDLLCRSNEIFGNVYA